MLPRSGQQRPRFLRRRSSKGSTTPPILEEPLPIQHKEFFLDDRAPSDYFKLDILRLIHCLRIHGWSQVDEASCTEIRVDRISGALTNAVYSVKVPPSLEEKLRKGQERTPYHQRPLVLLLRVYGPNCDTLIDREYELRVLEELTKHNIGAKLLGTFTNGRFEQFLRAQPLTRDQLRDPEISTMIAKRMRDLHDNIPVAEIDETRWPTVFSCIDKWTPVAQKILEQMGPKESERVLGTHPNFFFETLDTFREWLVARLGGIDRNSVVFSHNDTQYGNILKLEPPKGSPLLQAQNEHRTLVVIDFEYSGPNYRAYDIANHFCEWMSDYHHPTISYHIWLERYPSTEEQKSFISSYVEHGSPNYNEELMALEEAQLFEQVKLWTPLVSAYWAIWGIVQTPGTIPIEEPSQEPETDESKMITETEEDLSFNYIEYSREKFALFWQTTRELGLDPRSEKK